MDIMDTMIRYREDQCSVSYRILIGCAIFCYIILSSGFVKTFPMYSAASRMIYAVLFIFILFRRILEGRFSGLDGILIGFYLVQLISTCMVSHDYSAWLLFATQGLGAFLYVEEGMWEMPIRTMLYTRNILFLLSIANTLSVVLFQNGFGGAYYYVFGYRIGFTPFIVLGLVVSLAYDYLVLERRISIWTVLFLICSCIALLLQMVSTGLLCTAVLMAAVVCYCTPVHRLANYWFLLGATIVLFLILAVWNNADWFTAFFEAIGKDATLNMRTVIWAEAKRYIAQKPIWGHGVTESGAFMIMTFYYKRPLPSHNQILHILYEGGAVSCLFYGALFFVLGKKLRRWHKDYISYLMVIAITVVSVMMITEIQTQKALVFMLFAFAYTCVEYRPIGCWELGDDEDGTEDAI